MIRAFISAKELREYFLPSTPSRLNSGASEPIFKLFVAKLKSPFHFLVIETSNN